MSCSSRSCNKKSSLDKQEPSRVLLVCVYDTIAFEVTNQAIYEKFSKFGSIIKVLIFDKAEVTKLFVQFTTIEHASNARAALDGTKLLGPICKMSIYFSNLHNVDLKNQTSEGADFTAQEEMKNQYFKKYDHLTRSFQGENNEIINDDLILQTAFSTFPSRSKTDNPKRIQEEISKVNRVVVADNFMINEEEEIDHLINNGIFNILDSKSNSSELSNQKHSTMESVQKNPPLKLKQAQSKTSILSFEIIREIEIRNIYNLFSNFGNISFICLKKKKAFIKFRTVEFAAIAFTYLNDYVLMGNVLKIEASTPESQAETKENEYSECTYFDQSYDRFTPNRSLTVNSPSYTLHVSSLKREICKESTLFEIFSDYGKVEAVKILFQSNEKNMALVKFYSMEDSFQAISELHNSTFSGRKMQISFTKSRV